MFARCMSPSDDTWFGWLVMSCGVHMRKHLFTQFADLVDLLAGRSKCPHYCVLKRSRSALVWGRDQVSHPYEGADCRTSLAYGTCS